MIKENWIELAFIFEGKRIFKSLYLKVTWKVQVTLRLPFPSIWKFKSIIEFNSLNFRRLREHEFKSIDILFWRLIYSFKIGLRRKHLNTENHSKRERKESRIATRTWEYEALGLININKEFFSHLFIRFIKELENKMLSLFSIR